MRSLDRCLSAAVLVTAVLAGPTLAATSPKPFLGVPAGALIEKVVFDLVPSFEQGIVLDRIGVKPGDILTTSTIQRIARQLKTLRVQHAFSYQQGTKPGGVILLIGGGC